MPTPPDWRYLFLPEDGSPAARHAPPGLRACKTALWFAAAVALGMLLGRVR